MFFARKHGNGRKRIFLPAVLFGVINMNWKPRLLTKQRSRKPNIATDKNLQFVITTLEFYAISSILSSSLIISSTSVQYYEK